MVHVAKVKRLNLPLRICVIRKERADMYRIKRPIPDNSAITAVIGSLLILIITACGGGEPTVQSLPTSIPATAAPTAAPTQIPPADTPTPAPSPTSELIAVPISVKGARDLGTLHIELVYDPAILKADSFESGELAQNALVEVNPDTPGRVVIGIIDTDGIQGDGPVVIISFKPVGQQGNSTLALENVTAHSATTLIDVPTTTVSSGTFAIGGGATSLPEIVFGGAN